MKKWRNIVPVKLTLFVIIQGLLLTIEGSGRNPENQISRLDNNLSPDATILIDRAFEGINSAMLIDYHVHVFGTGTGNTGNMVNPKMQNALHPVKYAMYKTYLKAAGITDNDSVDQQYIGRLKDLISKMPQHGKYAFLAFDKYYNPDGTVNPDKTEYYVSNEYVFDLAEKNQNFFIPVMSVHPYRKDALEELEKFARRGGNVVKWLPNAMGIDPSDVKCEPFYKKMKELKLVLLSHAGDEKAVDSKQDQRFGNPLLLKKPMNMGVKVIVAHCASLGKSIDIEDPDKKLANNFDLFIRLMERKEYQELLFADISALTLSNRAGTPLKTMLHRTDLHARLVNGSDYPLPAVNIVIRLNVLVKAGYISKEESVYLKEIFEQNPLLFDFVLKRTLKDPETGRKFPVSVFMGNNNLGN